MNKNKGMTLVEVLIASVMLFVVAMGALSYQYHSIKQKRIAWADMAATRTAQMVMEDWKSTGGKDLDGTNGYDPNDFDADFAKQTDSSWKIIIEDIPMHLMLDSQDIETDEASGVTLKKLQVEIKWRSDFADGSVDVDSPSVVLESYIRTDSGV